MSLSRPGSIQTATKPKKSFLTASPQQRRRSRGAASSGLRIEALEDRRMLAVLDLTTAGSSGSINNAIFGQTDFDGQAQGTGVINSFLLVQSNGMEEGYNTDGAFQYDEKSGTNSLLLSELPTVFVGSEPYREFRVDINENDDDLSLDELQIYLEASPNLGGAGAFDPNGTGFGNPGHQVYDLDGGPMGDSWVKLNYGLNAGSGKGDVFVYIPEANFEAVINASGSLPADPNVYLYSKFGEQGVLVAPDPNPGTWTSSNGFEEWSVGVDRPLSTGSIHGYKFLDENNDGIDAADPADPRLAGVQIFLDGNGDDMLQWTDSVVVNGVWDPGEGEQWTVTDANGEYWFMNLVAGLGPDSTYVVREVTPPSTTQSTPNPGPIELVNPGDTYVAFSGQVPINQGETEFVGPNLAFGNGPQDVLVSGTKYEDLDGDGTDDGGTDPGIQDWQIFIDADNDQTLDWTDNVVVNGVWDPGEGEQWTATDSNGDYSFLLLPGNYSVCEVQQSGWTQTAPNSATGCHDIVVGATPITDLDFGNFQNVDISGHKWDDTDGDGLWDVGEPGIAGWEIFLDDGVNPVVSTLTDVSGQYSFTNLGPGSYSMTEDMPAGWTNTYDGSTTIMTMSGQDQAGDLETTEPLNFGNFQNVDISGHKWNDTDGDGLWDVGEPGIAGWEIFLDDGVNPVVSTLTDASGQYSFTNLGPGSYSMTEDMPAGWTNTYDGSTTIVTMSGQDQAGDFETTELLNFGNFQNVDISGHKWNDTDGDGLWDVGEPGIAGWEIFLDDGVNPVVSTLTDASGQYSFTNLGPGSYMVSEDMPAGWTNTYDGSTTIMNMSGQDQAGDFETTELLNFGNFQNVDISGHKWNDTDGDGLWDVGEPGIAGWEIFLDDGVNPVVSTLTDASGQYSFTNLGPGSYTVTEDMPAGWTNTYDGSTTIMTMSGQDQAGDFETTEPLNFGNFQNVDISGHKWNDTDGDGLWDVGEPGIAGWEIFLDDGVNPVVSTLTDASGQYSFTNLGPGSYSMTEDMPAGWTNTYDGSTTIVTMSGQDQAGDFETTELLNFGNFQNVDISGHKWNDTDGDGLWDVGEPGIAGWEIFLDDGVNPVVSTLTDASGQYSFTNLGPGSYMVSEDMPAGWTNTYDGSTTIMNMSGQDQAGDFETTELLNFGNFQNVDISGHKWNDTDGDGLWDVGEPGIAGWEIFLDDGVNPVVSTLTDASGQYSFTNLGPGSYTVTEDMPAGWTNTYDGSTTIMTMSGQDQAGDFETTEPLNFGNFQNVDISGHKWNDTDGDGLWDVGEPGIAGWEIFLDDGVNPVVSTLTDASGQYSFTNLGPGSYSMTEDMPAGWTNTYDGSTTIMTMSGQDQSGDFETTELLNFGNFQNVDISGHKWNDTDGDGLWDVGEPGIAGWEIFLDDGVNPVVSTLTDASGQYSFTNLGPGSYSVTEDMPAGWTNTYDGSTTIMTMSGQDQAGDFETTEPLNFGNFQNVDISGHKWDDVDGDGLWDVGEPGIVGWEIFLDDGVNPVVSTLTDASGQYSFTNLGPGSYTVSEDMPAGWTNTYDGSTTIMTMSGQDQAGDFETTEPLNFGNFQNVDISGHKWDDVDGDGLWDVGEPGIAGWEIFLDDGVNPVVSTFTDASGQYSFTNLGPGSYSVSEDMASGWTNTYDGSTTILTMSGQDQSGDFETTEPLNFGNFQNVDIIGHKWDDVDGDGLWDVGEPGIAGWEIFLDDGVNPVVSTLTDVSGQYSFTNLGPGSYSMTEDMPSGWTNTYDGSTTIMTMSGQDQSGDFETTELLNFGNFQNVDISGHKWNDVDGDGLWDVGEPGIVGWEIFLDDGVNPVVSTLTDVSGQYSFTNLGPGSYSMTEDMPSGWTNTYDGSTTIMTMSGQDQAGDFETTELLNFGNFQNVDISGHKWDDVDGDGLWDVGEPGIVGWEIFLDDGVNPVVSTLTDASGQYSFTNLGPGSYTVTEDMPSGWTNTYDGSTTIMTMSGQDQAGDFETTELLNFGNFQNVDISGHKWDDVDGDGLWDVGEPGIVGWEIFLDDGVNPVVSTFTDASGQYSFTNLGPGSYTVTEDMPAGWTNTYDGSTTIMTMSGQDQAGDFETTEPLNFGNFQNVDISGHKWNDTDGDGLWDVGEPGIVGWEIFLDDGVNPVVSTLTDASGQYSFTNLGPGSYTVTEDMPAGWTNTYDGSTTIVTMSGQDQAGDFETTELLNFGNFELASIHGLKFHDCDADGVHDVNEPGVEGVTILLIMDGMVVDTTTTGSDGRFWFVNLAPGTYSLEEVLTDDFIATTSTISGPHTLFSGDELELGGIFGNIPRDDTDARTIGFWRNVHGREIIAENDYLADLRELNLRDAAGADYDPLVIGKLSKNSGGDFAWVEWLQGANADNMAYMLSAQMAAMWLNIAEGFVDADDVVLVSDAGSLVTLDIGDVVDAANELLALNPIPDGDGLLELFSGHPDAEQPASDYVTTLADFDGSLRDYATFLKDILDAGNNNENFVVPCPENDQVDADFDDDGIFGCHDINALTADIAAGFHSAHYDLTQDGQVNHADLSAWLSEAGEANLGFGKSYLPADANLSGTVDGIDFVIWNASKFTTTSAFCSGDFNASGVVDGLDFVIWNSMKFTSSDVVNSVSPVGKSIDEGLVETSGVSDTFRQQGSDQVDSKLTQDGRAEQFNTRVWIGVSSVADGRFDRTERHAEQDEYASLVDEIFSNFGA